MSALYELTSDFTELFNRFDEINDYEPDTDADGNYIDAAGNIIDDVVKYKQDMLDMWLIPLTVSRASSATKRRISPA